MGYKDLVRRPYSPARPDLLKATVVNLMWIMITVITVITAAVDLL